MYGGMFYLFMKKLSLASLIYFFCLVFLSFGFCFWNVFTNLCNVLILSSCWFGLFSWIVRYWSSDSDSLVLLFVTVLDKFSLG